MSLDEGCDLLAEGEDVAGGRDAWSEVFAPVARAENGFDSSPIVNSSVDFGADDAFFGHKEHKVHKEVVAKVVMLPVESLIGYRVLAILGTNMV